MAKLILDDIGNAQSAYSVRKLKTSAQYCMRVREDSGDTEIDIGFDCNVLDITALLDHCGANNGFVVRWYDQTGNGYHLTNSGIGHQPRIVESGNINFVNGIPAVDFLSTVNYLDANTPATSSFNNLIGSVFYMDTVADTSQAIWGGITTAGYFGLDGSTSYKYVSQALEAATTGQHTFVSQSGCYLLDDDATEQVYGPANYSRTGLRIGELRNAVSGLNYEWNNGSMQEWIEWTDNTLSLSGIQANQRDYFINKNLPINQGPMLQINGGYIR